MPQMAVLTGKCDELPCFLTGVGVDPSEFTGPAGGGRVHVYRGAEAAPDLSTGTAGDCSGASGPCPLWSTKAQLERYDLVLLGCECDAHDETKPDMRPMHDWLDEGGKVLAVHSQATWFENGPPDFRGVATWASTTTISPGPFRVDTSFPKGQQLQTWLADLGALDANQAVALNPPDVTTSVATVNAPTTRWIYDTSTSPPSTKYLSFGTPIGGIDPSAEYPSYCGKVIFTDVHAGGGSSINTAPVPAGCTPGADLTPEEKALEFVFFDSTACVEPADAVPPPP